MIKDALQYLIGLAKPVAVQVGEQTFYTDELKRPPSTHPAPLKFASLSGVAAFTKENVDAIDLTECICVVESPTSVTLAGKPDDYGRRPVFAQANADLPQIAIGQYQAREAFHIGLLSLLADSPERAEILQLVGVVEAGGTRTVEDDGVTQQVVVQQGVASKARVAVRPLFQLAPYSTFTEVEQVVRPFIFRIREKGDGIECALFEADGGAWRNEARKRVASWLAAELNTIVPVLF